MRLPKFLFIATFVTLFALLYVCQQTEIFRLAYVGQKRLTQFQDLLDKNASLRYNIGRKASLVCIGSKVSHLADFQMPDTYRLVRLHNAGKNVSAKQGKARENIFAKIFSIKAEAEAKTINTSNPSRVNSD